MWEAFQQTTPKPPFPKCLAGKRKRIKLLNSQLLYSIFFLYLPPSSPGWGLGGPVFHKESIHIPTQQTSPRRPFDKKEMN